MDGATGQHPLPRPLDYVLADIKRHVSRVANGAAPDVSAVLGLYHLLSGAEVTAKFLVAVLAGELAARGGPELDRHSRPGERPALGMWLEAARRLSKLLEAAGGPRTVPDLLRVSRELLVLAEGRCWSLPEHPNVVNLPSLRNWIAHGGVLSAASSAAVIDAAFPPFELLLAGAGDAFAGTTLMLVGADGKAARIEPTQQSEAELRPVTAIADLADQSFDLAGSTPGLYLGALGSWVAISPIVRFAPPGAPKASGAETLRGRRVLQVFVRLQGGAAQYAPLDTDAVLGVGERTEAATYRDRFTDRVGGFWSDALAAEATFVGRDRQIERVLECLQAGQAALDNGKPSVTWWMFGKIGRGKSALVSAAAVRQAASGSRPFLYAFRSGDAERCGTRAFVRRALDEVPAPADEVAFDINDHRRARSFLEARLSLQRPTVICDGVDELERSPFAGPGDVQALFELARHGGVWLFTSRSRPGPHAQTLLGEVGQVFEGGLPAMEATDLRLMVWEQALAQVRDAIFAHETQTSEQAFTNPYLQAIVDKADGSPKYLTLLLEWLARKETANAVRDSIDAVVRDPAALPHGLTELYGQLLDDWGGLGVLATMKTPLLCTVARSAEPLDASALAEMLQHLTAQPTRDRVAQCQELLALFAPVLAEERDADGQLGYRVDHDSFAEYLAVAQRTRPVYDWASEALAERASRPSSVEDQQLRRHLFRYGTAYLVESGAADGAASLLSDMIYLHERLQCLSPGNRSEVDEAVARAEVDRLLDDYDRVGTAGLDSLAAERTAAWARVLRSHAHLLRRTPVSWGRGWALVQVLVDHADKPAIRSAVRAWCERFEAPPVHLVRPERANRPSQALIGTLELPFSPGQICVLASGEVAVVCQDGSLYAWHPGAGGGSARRLGTEHGLQVLRLPGDRVLGWSYQGVFYAIDLTTGQAGQLVEMRGALLPSAEAHGVGALLAGPGSGERADSSGWYPGRRPDEPTLAFGGHTRLVTWCYRSIAVWNPDSGESLARLDEHERPLSGVLALADSHLASWSADALKLWTLKEPIGLVWGTVGGWAGVWALPGGRFLAWKPELARVYEAESGQTLASLEWREGLITGVLALPGGSLALTAGDRLWAWEPGSGDGPRPLRPRQKRGGPRLGIRQALAVQAGLVATVNEFSDSVHLWDLTEAAELPPLKGHTAPVLGITTLVDGRLLSWSEDRMLRVWDLDSRRSRPLWGHTDAVAGSAQLPDGRVISWGGDATIRVWDLTAPDDQPHPQPAPPGGGLASLGQDRLASWKRGKTVSLWDSSTGRKVGVFDGHRAPVQGGRTVTADTVATWAQDGSLLLWDAEGRPVGGAGPTDSPILEVLICPDQRLALRGPDAIEIWDPRRRRRVDRWSAGNQLDGAAALADGRLVLWSEESPVTLWRPRDGHVRREVRQLDPADGSRPGARGVTVLDDATMLAWTGEGVARLWDVVNGKQIRAFRDPALEEPGIVGLGGGCFATWCRGGLPSLWDFDIIVRHLCSKASRRLAGHTGWVAGVRVLAKDRLLSWSYDATVRIWDPGLGTELERGRHVTAVVNAVELPSGRIAAWAADGSVIVWDGELRRVLGCALYEAPLIGSPVPLPTGPVAWNVGRQQPAVLVGPVLGTTPR